MLLQFPSGRHIKESAGAMRRKKCALAGQQLAAVDLISQTASLTAKAQYRLGEKMTHLKALPAQRPPKFTTILFHEIDLPDDADALIEGFLYENTLAAIYGKPKGGKSYVAMDWGLHIALGRPYRGNPTKQGTVLYVACEGVPGIKKRLAAFKKFVLNGENPVIPFHLCSARLDLIHDYDWFIQDMKNIVGDEPVRLIIIDTLNKSLVGSENSDQDMGSYLRAAEAAREAFNACVLIIHHCGHDNTRPRGHSSLVAAVDSLISVQKKDGRTIVKSELMKDEEAGTTIAINLREVKLHRANGKTVKTCIVEHISDLELGVRDLVAKGLTYEAIGKKLNLSKDQVYRIVHAYPLNAQQR